MKRLLTFVSIAIFSMFMMEVSAQGFLKNLKNAVKSEVVNKVKREVDKGDDKLKGATEQTTPSAQKTESRPKSQAQHRAQAESNAPQQTLRKATTSEELPTIAALIDYGPTEGSLSGHAWVDMGLPSGTRWATCNVGAVKAEQPGKHYGWGEVSTKSTYTQENSKTHTKAMPDISGDKSYDVATASWGAGWRMPTEEEFAELLFYCNWDYVQQGGRWGSLITSPKTGNSIFLPATGFKEGASHELASTNGYYWTSTPCGSEVNNGAYMYQYGGALGELSSGERSYGFAVRPVMSYDVDISIPSSGEIQGHKFVDLGLPSGVKWATANVGSNAVDQDGDYYAWGDTIPFTAKSENKNCLNGKWSDDIAGNAQHDIATASWGGSWRMPTVEEFYELIDNCAFEWTTIGRRSGIKATSRHNGNYIFLPASGEFRTRYDAYGHADDINEVLSYWTSTPKIDDYNYDAYAFTLSRKKHIILPNDRYYGFSIRPVSD